MCHSAQPFEVWLLKMKPPGGAAPRVYKDLRMSTAGPEILGDPQAEPDLSHSIS